MENNKESNNFIKYFEEDSSLYEGKVKQDEKIDPCLTTIDSINNLALNLNTIKSDDSLFEKKVCRPDLVDLTSPLVNEEKTNEENVTISDFISKLHLLINGKKFAQSLLISIKGYIAKFTNSFSNSAIINLNALTLKKKLAIASVLAFAIAFSGNLTSLISDNPIKSATAQLVTGNDPVDLLTAELNNAYKYALTHNNSFYGFTPISGINGVAGAKELVLTLFVEGKCWSTGVADGYPSKEIRYDPSGVRCQPSNLEQLKLIIK